MLLAVRLLRPPTYVLRARLASLAGVRAVRAPLGHSPLRSAASLSDAAHTKATPAYTISADAAARYEPRLISSLLADWNRKKQAKEYHDANETLRRLAVMGITPLPLPYTMRGEAMGVDVAAVQALVNERAHLRQYRYVEGNNQRVDSIRDGHED